jgi:tRNA(Ile)-lysidine synthase
MVALAPFERAPRLAVGVSGGPDSLALTLLADRWARRRGGSVVGLTVDHGLRAEATAEAARVGMWLAGRGIRHHILPWRGPKPSRGLQATARAARRELLTSFCRADAILHLLLAHQQDDQAETLVMRLAADSGLDGLAGIARVAETPDLRILRPVLDVPRTRLAATLRAANQPWIEDPANRDPRFSRSRVRSLIATGLAIAAPAARFARARAEREAGVAAGLAGAVALYPEGWAVLAPAVLAAAPLEIGRRMLARVLMCVGAQAYPPRRARLDPLYDAICGGALAGGRTLAGCRLVPVRRGLVIARELAAVGPEQPVAAAGHYVWDERFRLRLAGRRAAPATRLRALGEAGWAEIVGRANSLRSLPLPPVVRATLPALYDLDGVAEVPHLTYRREGLDPDSVTVMSAGFRPRHILAGAGFAGLSPADGDSGGDEGAAKRPG